MMKPTSDVARLLASYEALAKKAPSKKGQIDYKKRNKFKPGKGCEHNQRPT